MSFFSTEELKKTRIVKTPDQLNSDCFKCKLDKNSQSPKIEVSGKGAKKILIIGEGSLPEEDLYGNVFVGETGSFLSQLLKKGGIHLDKDCWKVNAVRCLPDKPKPTHKQIQCCAPLLEKTILELKPTSILLCGSVAITSLFGKMFSNREVKRWNLYPIPDEKFKCNIIPIHHPDEIFNEEKDRNLQKQYKRDIKKACHLLQKPFVPSKPIDGTVTRLTDFPKIKRLLLKILKKKTTIAYDYETTGLKPYRKGHKIVSIGFAVSSTKAYAFPFNLNTFWTAAEFKELEQLWKQILKDKKVQKIAYNEKFEKIWAMKLLKVKPHHIFDPMIAIHVLDNRGKAGGLKFQSFVQFGFRPYDDSIKPFIQSKKGEFNTIERAPLVDLLTYNGLDCIFTFRLYKLWNIQIQKNKKLLKAYHFLMKSLDIMAQIQHNGISADSEYYLKIEKQLEKKVKKREKYLTTGREARAFKKQYGRALKVTSNKDLGELFYKVLGKPAVYTAKGNYKTDKATMESLKLPFVTKLLEMKKYEKAKGTYLGQFKREIVLNRIHAFFDLHIPVSYRSSSSMPNQQNLPARDFEIAGLIRKGLVPSLSNGVLVEADFGGAEVISSASFHRDKNFINYLLDKSADMHRDIALDLWQLPFGTLTDPSYNAKQKKRAKMIRFFAKNNWTFAQFYGDWFASCGEMLWENVINAELKLPSGQTMKDWISKKGIHELGEVVKGKVTPGSFLDHCKKVEKKMWEDRFPEYTQWKKDIVEFYQNYGYIENHFGFRFIGYMSQNQCCNFPIQSTSFHLLLDTLITFTDFLKKNNYKVKAVGQVHDSLILDCHIDHVKPVLNKLNSIVESLQSKFDWLPVPMEMEYEISKMKKDGGSFSEMKEYTIKEINDNY